MRRLAALAACLLAGFILFYAQARSPEPLPRAAPANRFSAGRALEDIKVIAAAPHPTGSVANAAVRDYLVARLAALGLSPRVQRTDAVTAARKHRDVIFGGVVENVVGVLPGRDPRLPALVLMAHYDSVPGSPGAADDAAGVAAALEIARVLKAKGVPARDVVVLLTDGEEGGLLGASAFYAGHPLAARAGYVVNLEARGNGGRASLFQTGPGNGAAIDLYRRTTSHPNSNSLTAFIYNVMPNDTDMTVSLARGVPGLNFAFLGRQFDYHAPTATVANLDVGAVQSLGDQVMGLAGALAFSTRLPPKTHDMVYGDVVGPVMVAYPVRVGWVVLTLAAALTAIGAIRARRAKAFGWRDLWKGVGAGVVILVGAALVLHLTRLATGAAFGWFGQRELLARFPLFEVAMLLAGLAVALLVPASLAVGKGRRVWTAGALLAGVAVAALGGFTQQAVIAGLGPAAIVGILAWFIFGRPACVASVWTGVLLTGLGVGLALQIAAPTAALTVVWPVTAAAALSALLGGGAVRKPLAEVAGYLIIVVTLAWVGGFLHGLMQGLDLPQPLALAIWLGAMLTWPLAWPGTPSVRWSYVPGLAALAGGLALALWLNLTPAWSARYPEAVTPYFVVNADTGEAWRASGQPPSDWSRTVLTADGGQISRQRLPGFPDKVYAAPARPVAFVKPPIAISLGPDGSVTITAATPPADGTLTLELKSDTVIPSATANGWPAPILTRPGQWSRLFWQAQPQGLTVTFKPVSPGTLDVRYAATQSGWPPDAKPLPPMPPTVMVFGDAGSTVVSGQLQYRW